MSQPKHILAIRFSAMGDVAMTVPVLRALTDQYPNAKVTVVTRRFFKPIFEDIPNVEVFVADLNGKHKGVLGLYKLSRELRKLNFHTVADLHNVLRSKILKVFFFGKQFEQIDKGRIEKKALVSGESFRPLKSTHQRYADVFKGLGLSTDLAQPKFPKPRTLSKRILDLGINAKEKIVGIAPFAAHKSKMYPLDQMEAVISRLSKDYNIILFGGGQKEIEILNTLESNYNNVISVAGKLDFSEELALISNLDLMLSMDSGNGHLAAMFGVKVITIWGVTHPFAGFAPFNQPEDFQLTADRNRYPKIPTSIYGNKYPQDYEQATGSIPIETVVSKIKSILS
ncbi:glycosyltransferase family 9 protein [Winogradskyella aquimaris]|uniref:Glycosyltransferase family 9 protein n=1 Tax=Winogradskyella aquimaris TaxID=864074 RepID=A0ABU5EKI3_9FLAO|nr:glycosyltransferase family 9 protein [Winogradskyella aquimaris]MDY2586466.1 glycosyltransferase family 9 protein [Winogradskyella aquimaris]